MIHQNLFKLLIVCTLCAHPVFSFRASFTARFHDLHYTLMRHSYCRDRPTNVANEQGMNDAQYLSNQIVRFIDSGDYSPAHLTNLTNLMDSICPAADQDFKVSANIDLSKYSGADGKRLRCKSVNWIMDEIYNVMRSVAVDPTRPMDFSDIHFYADAKNKSSGYPMIDLINTVWIKSEVPSDFTCNVTNLVKQSLKGLSSTPTGDLMAEKRSQQESGFLKSMWDYLARILDPIFGFQKRLYWEGSSRFETLTSSVRGAWSKGYNGTLNLFGLKAKNSTLTNSTTLVNSTSTTPMPIVKT